MLEGGRYAVFIKYNNNRWIALFGYESSPPDQRKE